MEAKTIDIHTEYIKLDQFLKLADIVSSGGEAKLFIQDTPIMVNGEAENRRGKKLRNGDQIVVKGKSYLIRQESGSM